MNIIETRDQLVELRKLLGITQQEMAQRMNVGQNAISMIENRPSVGWHALENYALCLDKKLVITIE